ARSISSGREPSRFAAGCWPEDLALSLNASPCPRAADGDRPRSVRAQDGVVIAKSSAAPWPILGVSDQICLGRIALDVTPGLQFMLGVAHERVPVIVRPKLAAAAQLLVRLARRVLL